MAAQNLCTLTQNTIIVIHRYSICTEGASAETAEPMDFGRFMVHMPASCYRCPFAFFQIHTATQPIPSGV